MEQTYSDKILSLHLEPCNRKSCENRDVCYHINKEVSDTPNWPFNFSILKVLKLGVIVYESICNRVTDRHLKLLQEFPNYNITIPFELFIPDLNNFKSQVQISVYNKSQINVLPDFWKLFLIKDNYTLSLATDFFAHREPKIHYILALSCVSKTNIAQLIKHKLEIESSFHYTCSLDSCLTSWITNSRCPYKHGNYIDLTYDGTMRTCPFDKTGMDITKLTMPFENIFNIEPTPCECKFKQLFKDLK